MVSSVEVTGKKRWRVCQGHVNALLVGSLLGQVGFWLWASVAPHLTTQPFGTDDFAAFWAIASTVLDGRAPLIYNLPALAALQSTLGLLQTLPHFYPPIRRSSWSS